MLSHSAEGLSQAHVALQSSLFSFLSPFAPAYFAARSSNCPSCFANHPRAGKHAEHVVNGDARLAINPGGYFPPVLVTEFAAILAPRLDQAMIQNFDLELECFALFHRRISSHSSTGSDSCPVGSVFRFVSVRVPCVS